MVILRDLRLSELDKSRRIDQQKALVFDHECKYDVILGMDFLKKAGIDLKYSTGTIQWFENELPMRDPSLIDNDEFLAMTDVVEQQHEDELFGIDWHDPTCHAIEILDAKYDPVAIVDIVVDDNDDSGIEAFPVFIDEDDERKINFIPSDDEVELPNNSWLTPPSETSFLILITVYCYDTKS